MATRRTFDRAVVTGGAGFLGSHLCRALAASGTEVICVDSFLTSPKDLDGGGLDDPNVVVVRRDVSEPFPIPGPVDLVLHFASPASPADYQRYPIDTMRAGSLGTLHALDLARDKGARFVLASTSEVYGDPLVHPQPEDYWGNVNPVGPRAVYDEAKRFAEALTTAYRTRHGADTAIARIFNTYGPGMRADDGRAVPTFIAQALAAEPLTVTGDGRQTRSICYVSDTVAGILALAASGVPGPVNIGNPEEMSIRALASRIAGLVAELTGVEAQPLRFVDRPVDDPGVRRPDISRAAAELGWQPRVGWRDGLARTVAWFTEHRARLTDAVGAG
ncbi:MAG: epimerase [Catenulispora sp. 13_1_20CM_3_70_7]|jgi:dTDP-glucose 4,6-dehydratase|nr:NAD-dependent epimerase/dehydratase family protein [Catenulisporales bacterium]OLE22975.1 MAG: epimerase [Catenulispora sp. 13_1_20CM_3_70_7]